MINLTITLDENDLKQARLLALQQGKSLNMVIRDFIKDYINGSVHHQQVTQRLLQKARASTFNSGGCRWTRDELYGR